eukprot:TRINITY_DN36403_c0_g1_i1.p1 TRINITY_DN36403_c0_g1~~TRINITY_DN36403_c0_g1_i1.p1  ORF type:complete len:760 (-),score=106.83 TRINITY_DN36403_c0_g1_i1:148-2397(-)
MMKPSHRSIATPSSRPSPLLLFSSSGAEARPRPSEMPKKSNGVACALCKVARNKMPKSWVLNDCNFYCPTCWLGFRCTSCGHHDPKGALLREEWRCRPCRHNFEKLASAAADNLDLLHKIIIEDQNGEIPEGAGCVSNERCSLVPFADHSDEDDEAAETVDEVAPLRSDALAQGAGSCQLSSVMSFGTDSASSRPDSQSHIVLLIDSSGSMRTVDVSAALGRNEVKETGAAGTSDDLVPRLDAAVVCAARFVESHSLKNPRDLFSVVAFGEDANVVSEVKGVADTLQALQGLQLRGAKGTMYMRALEAGAQVISMAPSTLTHLVMLSDGRPADTKAALDYFQTAYMDGASSRVRLHGIGFGASVQSFAPLQQLCCLSGGMFTLSGCSIRGLCDAFSSVSSTITSTMYLVDSRGNGSTHSKNASCVPLRGQRTPRPAWYELPGINVFGKKGVFRFQAECSSYHYDGDVFVKKGLGNRNVERRERPHMRGGMRLVYGFQDSKLTSGDGAGMVAKCSRFLDEVLNRNDVVAAHAKCSAVARHHAARFNSYLRNTWGSEASVALYFVPTFTYEAAEQLMDGEASHFTAERYLPGVFVKYNSNNGYVSEEVLQHHEVVQAFTHFSYVASKGKLLVADLQGVARQKEVLLTDPQVLSLDHAYGPGDLGTRGMHACLVAHRCGPTCKRLGLAPLSASSLKRLGDGAASRHVRCSSSAASSKAYNRVSDRGLLEYALSEGVQSSHNSASSWTYLLET